MSNYPPGVTGNEFEIAGADFETSETRHCPRCKETTDHTLAGYRSQRWSVCDECGHQTDLDEEDEYEPDFEEMQERQWDRDADAIEWGGLDLP